MNRDSASGEHGAAFLSVVFNHAETQRRPVTGAITIGRALDCDLWLDDPSLSRKHCRLERDGTGWAVVDLGSRNGTFINARRVSGRQKLAHDDVITIGKTHLTFHAQGYLPPRPTDPSEALLQPARTRSAIGDRIPTPHHAARPLPTPKVASQDTTIAPAPDETLAGDRTVAFTRPPATPIVRPPNPSGSTPV